MFVDIMKVLIL